MMRLAATCEELEILYLVKGGNRNEDTYVRTAWPSNPGVLIRKDHPSLACTPGLIALANACIKSQHRLEALHEAHVPDS